MLPSLGQSLSPMIQYHDLVAGNGGEKGFKDGPFYSAEFNHPVGIVLNAYESILYVADQKNNLIRAILLEKKNKVITLAGSVTAGRVDGPLSIASFNQPKDLAFLPHDRIAVFDQGNGLIRLIDLNKKIVSTIAGGGNTGQTEGDALKVQLGAIWNLVYFDKDGCLYFSLPNDGILQRLDLESGKISTVLKNNSLLPHPKALCSADEKFYIADQELPQVYEFLPPVLGTNLSVSVSLNSSIPLHMVGQAPTSILGLAGSGKTLYACQPSLQFPIYRFFPIPGPVTFASRFGYYLSGTKSPSGDFINTPGQLMPVFQSLSGGNQVGFIFDPRSVDRFYITNPSSSFIASIRDYTICLAPDDSNDIKNFHSKPPETFRILVCGRSYIDIRTDDRVLYLPQEAHLEGVNPLTNIPKRMEVELNTQAALEDNPAHFEVIQKGLRLYNLIVESNWCVPKICNKYDVDLVLILKDNQEMERTIKYLLLKPVDSDDVPERQMDMEFLLKPIKERFPSGVYHDFIQYTLSKKLVNPVSDTQWDFNIAGILNDSQARELLRQILGQPLKMLKKKMDEIKTSGGKTPQLVFCFYPAGNIFFTNELERSFWRELCREEGVTFLDLCDDFAAIGMTYHPYSLTSDGHFTENGMDLFSKILLHELNHNKFIPTHAPGL